ncbi:phosphatase [Spirochaetia bacterium]|nr:phosphatase [Spirochaetia bacterium]
MIDLHTHSSASDGDLKPAALVEKAALQGLQALALTDHDTIAGLAEAKKAAASRKIRLIPGVELEINGSQPEFPTINGEFHLLGLGIEHPTETFLQTLGNLTEGRERRNQQMVEKMRAAGINADYAEIKAFAGGGTGKAGSGAEPLVGRPHFGAFLISRKIVKNQEQAFKRWLGKGRPFYVPKTGLPFATAARLIHEAGGLAVLAHPLSLYVAWGRLPGLLAALKEQGLDGIEAWHPTAKVKACKRLEELGRSLDLRITAGSDFHGSARPERKLGFTAGDRQIGDEFLGFL